MFQKKIILEFCIINRQLVHNVFTLLHVTLLCDVCVCVLTNSHYYILPGKVCYHTGSIYTSC